MGCCISSIGRTSLPGRPGRRNLTLTRRDRRESSEAITGSRLAYLLPCAATALLVACLVGRWVFDADWGETVEDLAGDADGTLVGFVDDPRVTLDPGPSCPVALACAPAEATCDGSAVASCVDGSSLGVVRCELGCHEASAQCLLCEPGSHRCDAEIAAENKCAEDGLSWKLEEMCTTIASSRSGGARYASLARPSARRTTQTIASHAISTVRGTPAPTTVELSQGRPATPPRASAISDDPGGRGYLPVIRSMCCRASLANAERLASLAAFSALCSVVTALCAKGAATCSRLAR